MMLSVLCQYILQLSAYESMTLVLDVHKTMEKMFSYVDVYETISQGDAPCT